MYKRQAYSRWLAGHPGFEQEGHDLLKEWEVTARPLGKPDLARLARYEMALGGDAGLFGAIVADRRLFMGPDCAFTQDYRRRFTDDELLFILQRGIERVEALFDRLKPDPVSYTHLDVYKRQWRCFPYMSTGVTSGHPTTWKKHAPSFRK